MSNRSLLLIISVECCESSAVNAACECSSPAPPVLADSGVAAEKRGAEWDRGGRERDGRRGGDVDDSTSPRIALFELNLRAPATHPCPALPPLFSPCPLVDDLHAYQLQTAHSAPPPEPLPRTRKRNPRTRFGTPRPVVVAVASSSHSRRTYHLHRRFSRE